MQNGKFDKNSGTGSVIKLYEDKVFQATVSIYDEFLLDGKVVAKRELLPLTADPVYKTQYRNDRLRYAVDPITKNTRLEFFDAEKNKLNALDFLPELKQDYASIVCQRESKKEIAYVSVVIYYQQTANDLFLKDGSTTMDPEYTPTRPTDLVTKSYADDLIEDFTASRFPLKDISITQNDLPPYRGICHLDNAEYDVIFYRNYITQTNYATCKVQVEPFVIANNYDIESAAIALLVNGSKSHVAYLKDVMEGNSPFWRMLSSEDVYLGNVNKFFWKNSYEVEFSFANTSYVLDPKDPFVEIAIQVYDKYNTKTSKALRLGVDDYIGPLKDAKLEINYVQEFFNKYKTHFTSGVAYFPQDFVKEYKLPLNLHAENKWLYCFRPLVDAQVLVSDSTTKDMVYKYSLSTKSHSPVAGTFDYTPEITFTANAKLIKFEVFNLKGEVVAESSFELPVDWDYTDESHRVLCTEAGDVFPDKDYGTKWDPKKTLSYFEPKGYHGEFISDDPETSAICFLYTPKQGECYSHAILDIEHDGKMYMKAEGETGWLNCNELANPHAIPKYNDDPCALNEHYYTFGRVTYKRSVFIRIINATRVKVNSVVIE